VRELHADGLTDREIAVELGVSRQGVWVARTALRLKAHRRWRRFADAQLRVLHARGLTDGQIGRRLGVTKQTVGKRRQKLGLPPNPRGRCRA